MQCILSKNIKIFFNKKRRLIALHLKLILAHWLLKSSLRMEYIYPTSPTSAESDNGSISIQNASIKFFC
jgi:hypothetical protein